MSFPYTAPVGTQRNVVTLRLRAGVFIETGSVQIAILDGQSLLRCEPEPGQLGPQLPAQEVDADYFSLCNGVCHPELLARA